MVEHPGLFVGSPKLSDPQPVDPLAELVGLLRPRARFSKIAHAGGAWHIRRTEAGQPFYAAVLEGSCVLVVGGAAPVTLVTGDYVLIPVVHGFSLSGPDTPPDFPPTIPAPPDLEGVHRIGDRDAGPQTRLIVGHCEFEAPDAVLLARLLPRIVHVGGQERLRMLVELVREESRAQRPARGIILEKLVEVMFIEALRFSGLAATGPGLLRGLHCERLGGVIRAMHEAPSRAWTIEALAGQAGMSRSNFFARFQQEVGMAPMAYLLAWRMACARDLLSGGAHSVAAVARSVGYASTATFGVAFTRHVGVTPAQYVRAG